MRDAENLQKKLSDDEINIPKECLVTGLSSVVQNIPFQVILMWPTCSKNDFEGMYVDISDALKEKINANPLNFKTDGDMLPAAKKMNTREYLLFFISELTRIIKQEHLSSKGNES